MRRMLHWRCWLWAADHAVAAAGQVASTQGQPVQTPIQPLSRPRPPQVQGLSDEELDLQTVLTEPDFTIGVLPTTLRLPKHKMAFRITHRFTYQINGQGRGVLQEFLRVRQFGDQRL